MLALVIRLLVRPFARQPRGFWSFNRGPGGSGPGLGRPGGGKLGPLLLGCRVAMMTRMGCRRCRLGWNGLAAMGVCKAKRTGEWRQS